MYDVGNTIRLSVTAAPTTNVKVTVTQPDGTSTGALTPTSDGSGAWHYDFVPAQAGRHSVRWTSLDATFAWTDVFDVWPTAPRLLFSVDEAAGALGTRSGRASMTSGKQEQLRLYIAAVTPVIEDIVGPLLFEQRSRSYDGGLDVLLLPDALNSAGAVTVTENGVTITDFVVDYRSGILYAGQPLAPRIFMPGLQNIVVTFFVGAQQIPPNIRLAAIEELRFLYEIGQQSPHPAYDTGTDSEMVFTPAGFAVPRRVVELCGQSAQRVGGFA